MIIKKFISAILILATFLSLFSFGIAVSASDNAQTGSGTTTGGVNDAWKWAKYSEDRYMWKVSLYVAKSDKATTSSSLLNDFYLVGDRAIYIKNNGWDVPSGTLYGDFNKVKYLNGQSFAFKNNPTVITNADTPPIPIVSGKGTTIQEIKNFFGKSGTLIDTLQAIADSRGTTKFGLLSNLMFNIGGQNKKGNDFGENKIIPTSSQTNAVAWVIVYEPVQLIQLNKDFGNAYLALTATEYAIVQKKGWYNFTSRGSKAQNIQIITHDQLPQSVYLEEGWFGYTAGNNNRDDNRYFSYDKILKQLGWGMRFLDKKVTISSKDEFSISFLSAEKISGGKIVNTIAGTKIRIIFTAENHKNKAYSNIPIIVYYTGNNVQTIFTSNYNFNPYELKGITIEYTVPAINSIYSFSRNDTICVGINWNNRGQESNPTNNKAVYSLRADRQYDLGAKITSISEPYDGFRDVTVEWHNYTTNYDISEANGISYQILVNGNLIDTDFIRDRINKSNYITATYKIPCAIDADIEARINWENRYSEMNSDNNSDTKTAFIPEFSAFDVKLDKTEYESNQTLELTYLTSNSSKKAYTNIPVQIYINGALYRTDLCNYYSNTIWQHTAYIKLAPEYKGRLQITIRINWDNRYSEFITTNNEASASAVVNIRDLSIDIVEPNFQYTEDTTVFTSCKVRNDSEQDFYPTDNLKVRFTAISDDNSIVYTEIKTVVIPKEASNVVYFKWHIPDGYYERTIKLVCTVDYDNIFTETNEANNEDEFDALIGRIMVTQPDDPEYADRADPAFLKNAKSPAEKPNSFLNARWQEYSFDTATNSFVLNEYTVEVGGEAKLTPDLRNSAFFDDDNQIWNMRSGYGFYIDVDAFFTVSDGVTANQYTGIQNATALFPEFNYRANWRKFCSLEFTEETNRWHFVENDMATENQRLHFTQIWQPDGKYKTAVALSSVWTPAGMIYTNFDSDEILIVGSMYDDWYIQHPPTRNND